MLEEREHWRAETLTRDHEGDEIRNEVTKLQAQVIELEKERDAWPNSRGSIAILETESKLKDQEILMLRESLATKEREIVKEVELLGRKLMVKDEEIRMLKAQKNVGR